MTELAAYIEGIGLLGPGLDGWSSSLAVLAGSSTFSPQPTVLPMPEHLPPAERRRIGRVVKLALGVGLQATSRAGIDPAALPTVFASSGGDGHNCHEICQALSQDERQISPTRFHNSVHNAAAGYWGIATGAKEPSNALCAYDASFAAGLLEALTQIAIDGTRILLVAYDDQYLPPISLKRPIPDAFAVAFVLSPLASAAALARISACLVDAPADRMRDPALEVLRTTIPAARSLPLLYQLARGEPARINIDYLDNISLAIEVSP
jgi:hypothetical protein